MSEPRLENQGNRYVFTWAEEQIVIQLSKFYENKDGSRLCTLLVTTSNPSFNPHITQTRFNLSSSMVRAKLKNELSTAYPDPNWGEMLETVSLHALRLLESGEPVQELWTSDEDFQPTEFLVNPIVLKDHPTIIFGEKGVGKSTIALTLAACLCLPWHDNPLGLEIENKTHNVLLLDWEQSKSVVGWSLKELQRGMSLPVFHILYRRCYQTLAKDLDQIQNHINETGADVLIIDSMALACGGELKEAAAALGFYSALRQLDTTSIIIGQTSKDDSREKKVFGSTFFEYLARAVWEVRKLPISTLDKNIMDIALIHRQGNYTQEFESIGFRLHRGNDGLRISRTEPDLTSLYESVNRQQQAKATLAGGAMDINELQAALGISKPNAYKLTQRLLKSGEVVKLPDGKYGLITDRGDE